MGLFSRKNWQVLARALPPLWCDNAHENLKHLYQTQLSARKLSTFFYGESYPDELVLALNLIQNSPHGPSLSCFLSVDLAEQTASKQTLEKMLNFFTVFLDQYFSETEWEETGDFWDQLEYQKLTLYYKIGRENIALSLEADKFLLND